MLDQFAFKPSGSTTAALIFLLHTITEMLNNFPYAHVIALDFSKAFDSLSHVTLTRKLAATNLLDNVYNWIVQYLEGRGHRTKYDVEISSESKLVLVLSKGPLQDRFL